MRRQEWFHILPVFNVFAMLEKGFWARSEEKIMLKKERKKTKWDVCLMYLEPLNVLHPRRLARGDAGVEEGGRHAAKNKEKRQIYSQTLALLTSLQAPVRSCWSLVLGCWPQWSGMCQREEPAGAATWCWGGGLVGIGKRPVNRRAASQPARWQPEIVFQSNFCSLFPIWLAFILSTGSVMLMESKRVASFSGPKIPPGIWQEGFFSIFSLSQFIILCPTLFYM